MSDTFWVQFFGFLALIIMGFLKHFSDKADRAAAAAAAAKIINKVDQNTAVTIEQGQTQANKIDSAVKETTDKFNDSAQKVAVTTCMATEKIGLKTAAASAANTGKLEEVLVAINGRMTQKLELARSQGYDAGVLDGSEIRKTVVDNTNRIISLENGHDVLKNGQAEIMSHIDHAIDTLVEKLKS